MKQKHRIPCAELILLLTLFCLPAMRAMDLAAFNSGTSVQDWVDTKHSGGIFTVEKGIITIGPVRFKTTLRNCTVKGLPPHKIMYLNGVCSGENLSTEKGCGFRAYATNQGFKYIMAGSPAGDWRWATGTFHKKQMSMAFKVPADGCIDLTLTVMGKGGMIEISDLRIQEYAAGKEAPSPKLNLVVLPAQWQKNAFHLVEEIPAMLNFSLTGKAENYTGKKLCLELETPEFVQVLGANYRQGNFNAAKKWEYPFLTRISEKDGKTVFEIPDSMLRKLLPGRVAWWNDLYVYLLTNPGTKGRSGKMICRIKDGKKELCSYSLELKSLGSLPANRKKTKYFKTILGYPLSAESSVPAVRAAYAKFWNSLTGKPESFLPLLGEQMPENVRQEFRSAYSPVLMIGGAESMPSLRNAWKMLSGKEIPVLMDATGNPWKFSGINLPSIPYVLDDPEGLIWDKMFVHEIKSRLDAFPELKAVEFDHEPGFAWGFCPENRKRFAKRFKLGSVPSAQEILTDHNENWRLFRREQNAAIFRKFQKALKKHFPNLEFRICTAEVDEKGQNSTWCSVDVRLSVPEVKVFQDMDYFQGKRYFDTIKKIQELVPGDHYPLINPAERMERTYRKYTRANVFQNILTIAALGGTGMGFWDQDNFDGQYLFCIADAFRTVAEIETLSVRKIGSAKLAVRPVNTTLKEIVNGDQKAVLEFPEFSNNMRSVLMGGKEEFAVVLFNFDEKREIIAECRLSGIPDGEYYVSDCANQKDYGKFNSTSLAKGILAEIPPEGTTVLKITKTSSDEKYSSVTQKFLKTKSRQSQEESSRDNNFIQDQKKGNLSLSMSVSKASNKVSFKISNGKLTAHLDPENGDILELENTSEGDRFGEIVLENLPDGIPCKYKKTFVGIKDGAIRLEFTAKPEDPDFVNPQGFELEGLTIIKRIVLRRNSGKIEVSAIFSNHSPRGCSMPIIARVKNLIASVDASSGRTLIKRDLPNTLVLKNQKTFKRDWGKKMLVFPWDGESPFRFGKKLTFELSDAFEGVLLWHMNKTMTVEPVICDFVLPGNGKKSITFSIDVISEAGN